MKRYNYIIYKNTACANRCEETLEQIENDWSTGTATLDKIISLLDIDEETLIESMDKDLDNLTEQELQQFICDYSQDCDWGDGSCLILMLRDSENLEYIIYEGIETPLEWLNTI